MCARLALGCNQELWKLSVGPGSKVLAWDVEDPGLGSCLVCFRLELEPQSLAPRLSLKSQLLSRWMKVSAKEAARAAQDAQRAFEEQGSGPGFVSSKAEPQPSVTPCQASAVAGSLFKSLFYFSF